MTGTSTTRRALSALTLFVAVGGIGAVAAQQPMTGLRPGSVKPQTLLEDGYFRPPTEGQVPLSLYQMEALLGWASTGQDKRFRPGIYRISRGTNSGCLTVDFGGGPVTAHLREGPCTANTRANQFAILPAGKGVSIWPLAMWRGGNRFSHCASLAANVVFGPRRIDVTPCNAEQLGREPESYSNTDEREAVADRQFFAFARVDGTARSELRTAPRPNSQPGCWDLRGGTDGNGDVIKWDCHDPAGVYGGRSANQLLTFTFVEPLPADIEPELFRNTGQWSYGVDGHRRNVPVRGVMLSGATSSAPIPEAAHGNAAACATVCLGDRRCTGYTWTGNGWRDPRSQQANPPQCRISTQWYAQPTGWGPDHPGQMISGVMRGAHVIADAQSAR